MLKDKRSEILYKYRCFDGKGYHLVSLKDSSIWFSSPKNFSDPFDTRLPWTFEDNPEGVIKQYAENKVNSEYKKLNHRKRKGLVKKITDEFTQSQDLDKYRETMNEELYSWGICCLTTKKNNILMWSHYSDNHKGFCIGYDQDKLFSYRQYLFNINTTIDQVKIEYKIERPQMNFFSSFLSNTLVDHTINALVTKSKDWEYESEYRLIWRQNANKSLEIPRDIVSEIILGCNIEPLNREKIIELVKKLYNDVVIYQAKKSPNEYKLDFEEIEF